MSFTVPTLSCGPSVSKVAIWAGYGGYQGSGGAVSLPQAGVQGTCSSGAASWVAWDEWYDPAIGNPEQTIARHALPIDAGDVVNLTLYQANNYNQYSASFVDSKADGRTFNRTFLVTRVPGSKTPTGHTVECIVEAPTKRGGGYEPLADFGEIGIQHCYATSRDGKSTYSISQGIAYPKGSFPTIRVIMQRGKVIKATPYPASFGVAVVWQSA